MTREEFNSYVKLAGKRLYSLALRILRKQDEAEDAVQEVFIRMWKMGDRLDDYQSIDALATTMTKNYCIDQLRKEKMAFDNNQIMIDKADTTSIEKIIENAESFVIIQRIISGLPFNYGMVINQHDIDGFSYEEIAEKTGQNINTIRVNLSRARAMVREEYIKYFSEKRGN
ncbi:MAG TPA: RNA polymerase sigma factor [Bacteroidales bacterium]|jgi:RNA polymerase sigma-70 factor (ECF subfamily)|nr:RNA polymerase sigma factor [Bacteroidales bacterium]